MARRYRLSIPRKIVNLLMRGLLRIGLAPRSNYLLTTRGRRTGQPRSTPVTLVESGGDRWLVAPYGAVGWVHNVRAAGEVTLNRGRRSETLRVIELGPDESAPVLKTYLSENPITLPFFDATANSPLDAFRAESSRHPVFALVEPSDRRLTEAGEGS